MFIVIEGPDQVGKTEQEGRLVEWLRSLGRQVDEYSFPSRGTLTGRVVREWLRDRNVASVPDSQVSRDLAVTFQCVQLVDKYAAVPAVEHSLRKCWDVVCCRWWQSAYAYGLDEGLPREWLNDTCGLLPRANLNLLIDLDPWAARARSLPPDDHAFRAQVLDRYDRDLGKQERVRQTYLEMWNVDKPRTWERWEVVDGSGTPEEVHERVKLLVLQEVQRE